MSAKSKSKTQKIDRARLAKLFNVSIENLDKLKSIELKLREAKQAKLANKCKVIRAQARAICFYRSKLSDEASEAFNAFVASK